MTENQPSDKHPDESQPSDKHPDESQPSDKHPDENQPSDKHPDENQPSDKHPDESQPSDKHPDESQPSGNHSDESQSSGGQPTESQSMEEQIPPKDDIHKLPAEPNGHMVAIDAGHQARASKDKEPLGPGSSELKARVSSGTKGVSTGVSEYELNLTIAQALGAELVNRGYQIVIIRESHDVDISNKERAETANSSGAEIFLRIHANGSENSKVQGTLTICNTAKSPYNEQIYEESRRLSDEVLNHMVEKMGSKSRGVWETDTMSGINWSTIPVTIVEMGYMSNPDEDEKMQTAEYQEKIVQGIADGVDAYFNNR